MIIEQCRDVGCYYGVETETFGNFLCVSSCMKHTSYQVTIARLREVLFSFSEKGE
jgi:hypothetical protein